MVKITVHPLDTEHVVKLPPQPLTEIKEWFDENGTGKVFWMQLWEYGSISQQHQRTINKADERGWRFWFTDPDTAMLFKLRWS